MTLGKHRIDGIILEVIKARSATYFESLMINAGYEMSGSAPAKGNRIKIWFKHSVYRRVEAIYSPDKRTVITAYHV